MSACLSPMYSSVHAGASVPPSAGGLGPLGHPATQSDMPERAVVAAQIELFVIPMRRVYLRAGRRGQGASTDHSAALAAAPRVRRHSRKNLMMAGITLMTMIATMTTVKFFFTAGTLPKA